MYGREIRFLVWIAALFALWSNASAQLKCALTGEPSQVKLIYDDILHFLRAMDSLGDSGDYAKLVQEEYLDNASPGLQEYLREKGVKAEHFVEALGKRPAEYASLRELPRQLRLQEKKIRDAFAGLKKLAPNAAFMPVYYLVSPRPGGSGEPSEHGLMIAISELDSDIEKIHLMLVHETVHVQQALYPIPVRRVRVSPPASFRSCLTTGTLAFGSWFRSSRPTEDFHLQESRHAWRTSGRSRGCAPCSARALLGVNQSALPTCSNP